MIFPPQKLFIWLKQKFKTFEKSYVTINRFRTPANSKDGAICNNSLRLKAVYYGVVTRNSTLNIVIGTRPAFDYNGIL